jgi:hypothetical protein
LNEIFKENKCNSTSNSLHPGVVKTSFVDKMNVFSSFMRNYLVNPSFDFISISRFEGAQTSLLLCLSPLLKDVGGKYFSDCKEEEPKFYCKDKKLMNELWDWSEKECKNFENKN